MDCTSSVVYWPYVSQFDESYSAALATGESLSGSIPALLAAVQVPPGGGAPRFSPETFFHAIAAVMALCGAAFAALQLPALRPPTPGPGPAGASLLRHTADDDDAGSAPADEEGPPSAAGSVAPR